MVWWILVFLNDISCHRYNQYFWTSAYSLVSFTSGAGGTVTKYFLLIHDHSICTVNPFAYQVHQSWRGYRNHRAVGQYTARPALAGHYRLITLCGWFCFSVLWLLRISPRWLSWLCFSVLCFLEYPHAGIRWLRDSICANCLPAAGSHAAGNPATSKQSNMPVCLF